MNFSNYQMAIADRYVNSSENLSIEAVAGSGKSTTLQHLVKLTPDNLSVLVMAFNRDIVKDLAPRMVGHPNCQVKTFNSFGNQVLRANSKVANVDQEKTENALRKGFNFNNKTEVSKFYRYKGSINRLVDLFRANLITTRLSDEEIVAVADEFGVELPDSDLNEYYDFVRETYALCLAWTTYPDFRDQVFMPIYLNMPIPKFDVVFVDESQDLDRNQAELVVRAAKRLIMVGDSRQAILEISRGYEGCCV